MILNRRMYDGHNIKLKNRMFREFESILAGSILLLTLTGCQLVGDSEVPVVEGFGKSIFGSSHAGKKKPGNYRVRRGDTLYSIAWANDLDYRTLAQMNDLKAPYRIYAGQYLRTKVSFFESLGLKKKEPTSVQKKWVKAKPVHTVKKRNVAYDTSRYEVITPKKALSAKNKKTAPVSPPVYFSKKSTPVKGWRWPCEGRIVQGYSDKTGGNKGIDIAGIYGSPIRAAAAGKVVYSGSGLKGYGQLLLVKHNNSFLSAYAHNKRLLAKEGEEVAAGQKIAEMGRNNHGVARLHFEIRHNGQPINPMNYLSSARR